MALERLDLETLRELTAATVAAFKEKIGADNSGTLSTAITQAIAVSVDSKTMKDDAKGETSKAWDNWRNVARILADNGATKTEAKYVISNSLPNDSDLTHKSVDTYISRVVDLVPIYQLGDDKFASLWSKAKIEAKGEEVPPTKDMTHGNAAALIKTFKNPVPLPEDILSDKLKDVVRLIKAGSKLSSEEAKGMGDAEKRAKNSLAMQQAMAFVDGLLLQLNPPSAEQLPDVEATEQPQEQAKAA